MKYNKVLASLIVLLSLLILFVLPFAFLFELPEGNTKLFFIIEMPSIIDADIKTMYKQGNTFLEFLPLFISRAVFVVSYISFNVFGVISIYKILKNKKSIGMLKIMPVMLFLMISTYSYSVEYDMEWFTVPVGCVVSLILLIVAIALVPKKNGCVINYKIIILQMILWVNMMLPLFISVFSDEVISYECFNMSFILLFFVGFIFGNLLDVTYLNVISLSIFVVILMLTILVVNILIFSYSISDGQNIKNKRKTMIFYGVNIIIYILCLVLLTIVTSMADYIVGLHIFALLSVIGFIMALIDIRKDKIKNKTA